MNIKNHESYTDSTPYFALKVSDPKVGEVYEYKKRKILVVARQDSVCTVLQLMDHSYDGIVIRGIYRTNPYQMQYAYVNLLGDFQFCLKNEELKEVKRAILEMFADTKAAPVPVAEPYPIEEVHHPAHYQSDSGRECWDEMLLLFGKEALMWFCKLNIFKYRFRAAKKNGENDLKKADKYMDKLEELTKGEKKNDR